jgi:hypothetical protein
MLYQASKCILITSCLDGCCAMPLQHDLVESSCVVDKEETKDMCSLDGFAHLGKKIMCGNPMELVVFLGRTHL